MQPLKNLIKFLKKIFGTSSPSSSRPIFEPPNFDDFKIFLPKYLSDEAQENLFSELKYFPENLDNRFYTTLLENEHILFQGDGYGAILMPDYKGKTFNQIKAFLISNSCDASNENKRPYSRYLSFAPIIDLTKYKDALCVLIVFLAFPHHYLMKNLYLSKEFLH